MLIQVCRVNEYDDEVVCGTFEDLYHAPLFLKALLDRDNAEEQDNSYVIHYIHNAEDEEEE